MKNVRPEAFEIKVKSGGENTTTPMKERLERQSKDLENVDPVASASKVLVKVEEAALRRQAKLDERQRVAAERATLALERLYDKESREEEKARDAKKTLEEKLRSAEEKKELFRKEKQAAARKLAGGDAQGKLAREKLVEETREMEKKRVSDKILKKAARAARNKAKFDAKKISSAKKEKKQQKVKELVLEETKVKHDELLTRLERADVIAKNAQHLKVLKAQEESAKCERARARKQLIKEQEGQLLEEPVVSEDIIIVASASKKQARTTPLRSPEDKFFEAPHDDICDSEPEVIASLATPPIEEVRVRLYPRESIVLNDDIKADLDELATDDTTQETTSEQSPPHEKDSPEPPPEKQDTAQDQEKKETPHSSPLADEADNSPEPPSDDPPANRARESCHCTALLASIFFRS